MTFNAKAKRTEADVDDGGSNGVAPRTPVTEEGETREPRLFSGPPRDPRMRYPGLFGDQLQAEVQHEALAKAIVATLATVKGPQVLSDVDLTAADFREGFARWLRAQGYTGQVKLSMDHLRPSIGPFFRTLSNVCVPGRIDDYKGTRLRDHAKRSVQLELQTLRYLLQFCVSQGWLANPPLVPPLSKKAVGNRTPTSKAKSVEVPSGTMEQIIAALPTHAKRARVQGGRVTRIRGPFVVVYDQMLRPKQVESLLVPTHWQPGKRELTVTADIDKNRVGRPIPLSARSVTECEDAYAELERQALVPKDGGEVLLFGKFKSTSRSYLKEAAASSGLSKSDAKHFSSYDFKHNGVTNAAQVDGATLTELSAVSGVSPSTLDKRYLHPSADHARALVERRDARRAGTAGGGRSDGPELAESRELSGECEGRDSNPHRSYPTSTSTHETASKTPDFNTLESTDAHRNAPKYPLIGEHPQVRFEDPAMVLVAEARALLAAAERREPVSMARARAFARACVEMTETGRAAMVVMDGGVFAGARLVELAERIVREAGDDVDADVAKK